MAKLMQFRKRKSNLVYIIILLLLIASFAVMIYLYLGRGNKSDGTHSNKGTDGTQGSQNTIGESSNTEAPAISQAAAEQATEEITVAPPPESIVTELTTELTTQPETPTRHDFAADGKSDFAKTMFESATEVTDEASGEVSLYDKLPLGRDIEKHKKIVPLSGSLPYDPFVFFAESVFLGDSITSGFDLWRDSIKFHKQTVLENLNVIAVKSYSVKSAINNVSEKSIHPLYEGAQTKPEDYISNLNVKRIFIFLGLNDVNKEQLPQFIKNYKTLIDNIKSKNPDKDIIIMSLSPITKSAEKDTWSNAKIMGYNDSLIDLAEQNSCYFMDYASVLRDNENILKKESCSDGICHLEPNAYMDIVEYILYHQVW